MSMTREEAIVYFESLLKRFEEMRKTETSYWGKVHTETTIEAIRTALAALRPVSREQVERMRSRWITVVEVDGKQYSKCAACQTELDCLEDAYSFCPHCGAPMTDEAVEMVLERLNKLED